VRKQTFCSRLWNEVYINKHGNVFSCCCEKPEAIGNIYRERLQDICNGEIIQSLRQKSLSGRLECFDRCKLFLKDKQTPGKASLISDYGSFKRLKISFADTCNIHCLMCRRSSDDKSCLDFNAVVKQINLSPFNSIEIQGGEPLFIECAKKFFDYAASLNKKTSFLTNGILINDEWAQKIAAHSSFIYFSLNAATKKTHELINRGSKWELVLENIQKIRRKRDELHTPLKIIGHMTIISKNLEEIPAFINSFSKLGFDTVNFIYDIWVPFYLRCHFFQAKELSLRIKEAIRNSENRLLIRDHCLKLLGLV